MTQQIDYAVSSQWKTAYGILALMSMISSLTIPIIYKISYRTRHHPAGILVVICLCEIICCYHLMIWAMDIFNFVEFFGFQIMAETWTFHSEGTEDEQNYYNTECLFNQFTYFTVLYIQFTLYIILCIDLIITLKKPFISGKSRTLWYLPVTILSTTALTLLSVTHVCKYCSSSSSDVSKPPQLKLSIPPVLLTELVFYILGIVSIIMAVNNRRKTKNLSYPELAKAKDKYIKNHIILISLIFTIWLIPFFNNIYQLETNDYNGIFNQISFAILLSQGMFLGFIRLSEDYFRLRLILLIKQIFGKKVDEKEIDDKENEEQKESDNWNYTLATLMGKMQNEDLIKSLLLGIVQIVKFENSSSVLDNEKCEFPDSDEILLKWVKDKKKQKFYLNASQELIEIQNSLRKSHSLKSSERESLLNGFEVTILEYAPRVFQVLRKRYNNMKNDQLSESLSLEYNDKQIRKAQKSMGKSGSFFFFSFDHKIILKTITNTELDILINKFLQPYSRHCQQYPKQLISKCLGVFTQIIEGISPVHMIMMENSMEQLEMFGGCMRTYDLKGSLKNRYVKLKQQQNNNSITQKQVHSSSMSSGASFVLDQKNYSKVHHVMKDVNYIESEDIFIMLKQCVRDELFEQIKIDSEFLNSLKIMDYSLLLGIAFPEVGLNSVSRRGESYRCMYDLKGYVISISIIDYLQLFDTMKFLEYKYKTLLSYRKPADETQISCVFPDQYQNRFHTFMNSIICAVNIY